MGSKLPMLSQCSSVEASQELLAQQTFPAQQQRGESQFEATRRQMRQARPQVSRPRRYLELQGIILVVKC